MNKKNQRRLLLGTIATAPVWVKPIVTQVVLPAHALTSELANSSFFAESVASVNRADENAFVKNSLLDTLISPATAGGIGNLFPDFQMSITLSKMDGKVVASSRHTNNKINRLYSADNIPTDGSGPVALAETDRCFSPNVIPNHSSIEIVDYSLNDTSITVKVVIMGDGIQTQTVTQGTGTVVLECPPG